MDAQAIFPEHKFDDSQAKEVLPFSIYQVGTFTKPTQTKYPHRHDFYQILYFTEGSATHIIDGQPFTVTPPILYLLSPRHVHFWDAPCSLEGYGIIFRSDFLMLDAFDPQGTGTLDFFHSIEQNPVLKLTAQQAADITALAQAIEQEYMAREFKFGSTVSAYVYILLAKIQRFYTSTITESQTRSMLVFRFKQLVYEHFMDQHSVAFYATCLGVSAGHLADLVKAETGLTPGQIIRQIVIYEAKRLLINTDLTIDQIGHQLAYEDPTYFCRLFRRETQLSPGQFRSNIREKYQNPPG